MRLIGLAVVLGLVLATLAVEAQQAMKVYRVGVLGNENNPPWEGFRQGLRELGYVDGQSVTIEWRWSEGKPDRFLGLATEVVALKPDVIVAVNSAAALAAKQATGTLPIVFAATRDAVGSGLVPTLPGRAAMSWGCPSSPRSSSASVWNSSSRPFRGSPGSLPSGSQVARSKARTRTC